MRIGFWNLYDGLARNNYSFKNAEAPIGDELLLPFNVLHRMGQERGVDFVSLDLVEDMTKLDGVLFVDYPDIRDCLVRRVFALNVPRYLLTFEPEVVRPENWRPDNHVLFRRIFTWHDGYTRWDPEGTPGRPQYVKVNYSQRFPEKIPRTPRNRFAALIASNKYSAHEAELYSERLKTIVWFEQHAPRDLDVYGPGWNGRLSARGFVVSKRQTLKNYTFAICYENARIPGYITEKVFDCFIAGTIPIYLGAPNVRDYIPGGCFIDRSVFPDHASLHKYLVSLTWSQTETMRDAVEEFITGPRAKPFTVETFAETILGGLR